MADRKKLPDVMGDLLGGKAKQPEQPAPGAASEPAEIERAKSPQPASVPVRQPTRRPARQKASKPAPPPAPEAEEKIKATFYLSQETIDALEDAWLQLRRLATDRASVSKSAIVEAALEIALEELAKKGEKSALASRMAGL